MHIGGGTSSKRLGGKILSDIKNPHIQMPKSAMKPFSYKDGQLTKVYVLKLKDGCISTEEIKKFEVGFQGLYPKELEDYFANVVESDFGDVRLNVNKFAKKKIDEVIIDKKARDSVLSYLDNMFFRGEFAYKASNKYSMFLRNKTDFNLDIKNANVAGIFARGDWFVSIIINHSVKQFVAPRHCFYPYLFSGIDRTDNNRLEIVMPISPLAAIIVMPMDVAKSILFDTNGNPLIVFADEKLVSNLNKAALAIEKQFNESDGFIIAKRADELNELKIQMS